MIEFDSERIPRNLLRRASIYKKGALWDGGLMSVIVDFSIFPIGKEESVSKYASRAVKIIKDSGLPHHIGPMGTSIEGEWDEVMLVAKRCMEELKKDCPRLYMTMKVDVRQGESGRMGKKVRSVE